MPEELVIIIGIAIGAIWPVVKMCLAVGNFVDRTIKRNRRAAEKRKEDLYKAERDNREAAEKRIEDSYKAERDNLRQYVRVLMPNELDSFEKKLEAVRTRFEQTQRLTKWEPGPVAWTREEFRPLSLPQKSGEYCEMCVEDVEAILTPSPDSSTWSAEEADIINRQFKYPSKPPMGKHDKFSAFPRVSADPKLAVFEIDSSRVKNEDVERYFTEERQKVLAYNNRRADLLAETANLNSAIEDWNKRSRISWEDYVAESKKMEEAELAAFRIASELYMKDCREETAYYKRVLEGYRSGEKQNTVERLGCVLAKISLPGSVPHTWDIDFDEEQRIAVIDIGLPDVVHQPPYKTVVLKSGPVKKPLNQAERKEFIPKIHPAILLRTAYEVFRNDADETIKLLVINGWVRFDDPATGVNTKAYTASLMVVRDQITALNLARVDPLAAFSNLHGKSAGRLVEVIPIQPILSLNRNDSRFVNAKEVLKGLGPETNLAAMDWQEFEYLIRELFEKEFSDRGAEVKITQASRDRGVDAVVFDPDPIHGGKYVIQAKRYTNTVDVSAVRDLCAVVKKEGASRGILVTTSTYGSDAYAFANGEPITLLNGAELLGLLKKHGYSFKINLQEARRLV